MKIPLKLIKKQLQSVSKNLIWDISTIPNSTTYELKGLNNIREFIRIIDSLKLFTKVIDELKQSVLFTTASDSMRAQPGEAQKVEKNLSLLKELVLNFLDILLKTVPEENIDSINIKLPEVKDFDDLSKISRDIHIGLSQVILNDEIKGQTKIVSVENGSIWLNVIVGTTAVSVVASLAWSAAVIYKKVQEGKLLEQQIRGLKVKNESLEDILKAQKAETALMIQAEAEYINSQHFKENNPENIERIKNSISTFADLIGKGAEIQPALIAPETVANLFPDSTNVLNIESKIKKLANPSKN